VVVVVAIVVVVVVVEVVDVEVVSMTVTDEQAKATSARTTVIAEIRRICNLPRDSPI